MGPSLVLFRFFRENEIAIMQNCVCVCGFCFSSTETIMLSISNSVGLALYTPFFTLSSHIPPRNDVLKN